MLSKKTISSKIFILALLLLLVFLADLKYRQWQNQRQIQKQTESLKKQTDALEKKNNELNQSLAYINSPDFKESIAREQLNLKKQGEVVYGFSNPDQSSQDLAGLKAEPNFKKWWHYFFTN